jgi:hypothetical protein
VILWDAWKHIFHALRAAEVFFFLVGKYSGSVDECTVILEEVASQDLWI